MRTHKHALLGICCAGAFVAASAEAQAQSSFQSFSYERSPLYNNGTDTQVFRMRLANAAAVDDVRFWINRSGNAENGRTNDGYFKVTANGCSEITAGYGNDKIAVGTCEINRFDDGSAEVVARFSASSGFGDSTNNQVSAIWYAGGVQQSGWRKVTATGQGFAVATFVPPSLPYSLTFDDPNVANDGVEVQTFRLRVQNGANLTEARFLINRAGNAENGRVNDGYFRVQQTNNGVSCAEIGTGYGNDKITVLSDGCARTVLEDGSAEFVVRFVVEPSFAASTNHQVSALWYAGATLASSWKKVTFTGQGFNVVNPAPGFSSFSYDEPEVANDGMEIQTYRLIVNGGSNLTDVRVMTNRPTSENGRSYDGYFKYSVNSEGVGTCSELTTASNPYGNDKVGLLTDLCERNVRANGSVEFVFPFVVDYNFGTASNNQVSAIWYAGNVAQTAWRKVTTAGQGWGVVVPPLGLRSFGYEPEVLADNTDLQTLRLTLNSASEVDDLRLWVNRSGQSENGLTNGGYFRLRYDDNTQAWVCTEAAAGYGNNTVALQTMACEANMGLDGSVEFVLPYTIDPIVGNTSNNQVSAIWYVNGVAQTSWRKVTTTGQGFDTLVPLD